MKRRPIFITQKYSITLPKQIREKQNLQPGDCFDYEVLESGAILLTRKEWCQPPAFYPFCVLAQSKKVS